MASEGTFKHTRLDHTKRSIRILEVQSKLSESGLIQCQISHATIEDEYTCLSYMWGPEEPASDQTIFLNGLRFQVRRNLYGFLKVARKKYPSRTFWIDAICIDQKTVEERNHQVQQMGEIYKEALEVIIWLGFDGKIGRGIKHLHRRLRFVTLWDPLHIMSRIIKFHSYCHKKSQEALFQALIQYWSRAWVTQEVELARQVKILGHKKELNPLASDSRELIFFGCHWPNRNWEGLRPFWNATIYAAILDPAAVIDANIHKNCSDPRDRIFSLLTLCGKDFNLAVDYRISKLGLFFAVVKAIQKTSLICPSLILRLLHGLGIFAEDNWLKLPPNLCTRTLLDLRLPFNVGGRWGLRACKCDSRGFPYIRDMNRWAIYCLETCSEISGHLFCDPQQLAARKEDNDTGIKATYFGKKATREEDGAEVLAHFRGAECTLSLNLDHLHILCRDWDYTKQICSKSYDKLSKAVLNAEFEQFEQGLGDYT